MPSDIYIDKRRLQVSICLVLLFMSCIFITDGRCASLTDLNTTLGEITVDSIPFDSVAYSNIWSNLDATIVTTGLLHDRHGASSVNLDRYTGDTLDHDTCATDTWRQIYLEIYNSFMSAPTIPTLAYIDSIVKPIIADRKVPIALLYGKYNAIKDSAIEDGLLSFVNDQLVVDKSKSETPCVEKELFCGAKLYLDTWVGSLRVPFYLDKRLIASFPTNVTVIKISFGNGDILTYEIGLIGQTTVNVTYPYYGKKTVTVQAWIPNNNLPTGGYWASTSFDFWVLEHQFPNRDFVVPVSGLEATVINGVGNTTGQIEKPIIIVEGFDMGDQYNYEEICFIMGAQGMLQNVLNMGHDVIIVDFNDGTTDIINNRAYLEDLIVYVNQYKLGKEKNIVVGASMGGLIARYALLDMEKRNIDHDTRLFVSFDSPQQGANIPLALQCGIRFFAGNPGAQEPAQRQLNYLRSNAAQEMMAYHVDYMTVNGQGNIGLNNTTHTKFYEDLRDYGDYPTAPDLRKVAISNGSGIGYYQLGWTNALGDPVRLTPNARIANFWTSDFMSAEADFFAMPPSNDNTRRTIFWGKKYLGSVLLDDEYVNVPAQSGYIPLDHVPGGYRNTIEQLREAAGFYPCFPNHAFIPTTSALDLRGVDGQTPISPETVIHGGGITFTTPFDDVFCEDIESQAHVLVTAGIAEYLIAQINNIQDNWTLQNITIDNEAWAYRARNTITVAGPDAANNATYFNVTSTGELTLEAGTQIVLKPGFTAAAGSKVTASIETFTAYTPIAAASGYQSYSGGTDISIETIKPDAQKPSALMPAKTELQRYYPNPFNVKTNIKYALKTNSNVQLNIYNIAGQKVRTLINSPMPAGYHNITWDGKNDNGHSISRGVYLCRFNAGEYAKNFKMVLVK